MYKEKNRGILVEIFGGITEGISENKFGRFDESLKGLTNEISGEILETTSRGIPAWNSLKVSERTCEEICGEVAEVMHVGALYKNLREFRPYETSWHSISWVCAHVRIIYNHEMRYGHNTFRPY